MFPVARIESELAASFSSHSGGVSREDDVDEKVF